MALEQQLAEFLSKGPLLGKKVYIAAGAVVVGDVTLGDYSSVWYHAVLRGDINRIIVGHHTNLQDHVVLHLADERPCRVGDYVSVGHGAILHACTIGNQVLVGMGAAVLDGALVGDQCIIGARALITQETEIPPGSLVLGSPAKIVRPLNETERAGLKRLAEKYVQLAGYCLDKQINVSPVPG